MCKIILASADSFVVICLGIALDGVGRDTLNRNASPGRMPATRFMFLNSVSQYMLTSGLARRCAVNLARIGR